MTLGARRRNISPNSAVVAQLVERKLPKLEVAGSRPVRRLRFRGTAKSGRYRPPLPVSWQAKFDVTVRVSGFIDRLQRSVVSQFGFEPLNGL
jgi:hypothetical protein